jgi:hypothetical protein
MGSNERLQKELLNCVALECPPLLPSLRRAFRDNPSVSKLENILRSELQEMTTLSSPEADSSIYPGTTAGQAASCYRQYVDEILSGFFRRWTIGRSITASEKLHASGAALGQK